VTRSYVTSLRKGRIENPGFEKLRAIAKAMNFPPELWFEDVENLRDVSGARPRGLWTAKTTWRFWTRRHAPSYVRSFASRSGRGG
jgi:transcriptional regulator with XRE-family HTH domain